MLASELVQANQIDYPSIKNFVEVAVRNQINLIKYDIENRHAIVDPSGKLKAGAKREFTSCIACDKLFLNEKDKNLGENISKITGQKIYYMAENPTAENIAKHLLQDICPQLFVNYPIKCVGIKVYETPNCSAQIGIIHE